MSRKYFYPPKGWMAYERDGSVRACSHGDGSIDASKAAKYKQSNS